MRVNTPRNDREDILERVEVFPERLDSNLE
jgi:hypothetical protein